MTLKNHLLIVKKRYKKSKIKKLNSLGLDMVFKSVDYSTC